MLLANKITYKRLNKTIFENIDIAATPGKIIFIKGNNGSGKTTLIKNLVNILEPSGGDIYWLGKKLKNNLFNFYKSTTLILDKPTSSMDMTIIENIIFWKRISSSKINEESINRLLDVLKIDKYINTKTMYLSQGEVKKLELTRLILEQKKLWILDEPYNSLDSNSIELINDTFIDHVSNEGAIIFSSHYEPNLKNLEILSLF